MVKDYKPKGVAVVAISPNDPKAVRLDELGYTDMGDSFEEMKVRAKKKNTISLIYTMVKHSRRPKHMVPWPHRMFSFLTRKENCVTRAG